MGNARAAGAGAAAIMWEAALIAVLDPLKCGQGFLMIGASVEARAVALTGQAAFAAATTNTVPGSSF